MVLDRLCLKGVFVDCLVRKLESTNITSSLFAYTSGFATKPTKKTSVAFSASLIYLEVNFSVCFKCLLHLFQLIKPAASQG